MQRLFVQFGLSVALVVAWPLLGGTRAKAGYITAPALAQNLTAYPRGEGFDRLPAAASFGAGEATSEEGNPEKNRDGSSYEHQLAMLNPNFLSNTGGGVAGSAASGTAGPSTSQASLTNQHELPRPELAGWLAGEDSHHYYPPPVFGLFRPPRTQAAL
jgi:hypothetical protein